MSVRIAGFSKPRAGSILNGRLCCFPPQCSSVQCPKQTPKRLKSLEDRAQTIRLEIVPQLRRLLRTLPLESKYSGDEVAHILSMNRRTLNRRLEVQGTSFQNILEDVRFEAACQLLDATRIPLIEIAASLGYSESIAFSRH